jgi:hypothetical protein
MTHRHSIGNPRQAPACVSERRVVRRIGTVPIGVAIVLGAAALAAGTLRADENDLVARALPLIAKYCADCHSGDKPEGGLDVSLVLGEAELEKHEEHLFSVREALRGYLMPPPESPQPEEAERAALIRTFSEALDRIDNSRPPYAGHVPLRRLNRAEYHNTMRDLLGLELPLTSDFPADDTVHGFDNVADGLSISPLLLEKYLAAAERALEQVVVAQGTAPVLERRLAGTELSRGGKGPSSGSEGAVPLDREVGGRFEIPVAGEYVVRAEVARIDQFDVPATLVVKIDGVDAHVWNLPAGTDKPTVLEARVPLREGERRISLLHTWHTAQVPQGMEIPKLEVGIGYLETHGPLAHAAHRRIFFVTPGDEFSDAEAAEKILERFASLAFRRPVEMPELERLMRLYKASRDDGRSHIEGTRTALAAVLVSPHLLLHVERDESMSKLGGAHPLSEWELASRLSYFLWSSMPDETLRHLAAEGKLADDTVLSAEVKRMLADPKSQALVENFTGQWLGLRRLETLNLDQELYPQFHPSLRQSMSEEAERFFATMLHEDRSLAEFLSADWTWLNEELAVLYGRRDVKGNYFRQVALSDPNRGGILTMPATLAVTSLPTRTSAVKRGKWLLDEILGTPPPPPPPDVPELETASKEDRQAITLRERLERHRADPRCYACHVQMDTLGLGLENFDPLGRWRKQDAGRDIDPSGKLPDGQTFAGPAELKQILSARKEDFTRCLSEKMFVYALGRGLNRADRREVNRVADQVGAEGTLSSLITEVVRSYPFRYRERVPDREFSEQ